MAMSNVDLDQIAASLNLPVLDEDVQAAWPEAAATMPASADWIAPETIDGACQQIGVSADLRWQCVACARWITSRPAAMALAWLCRTAMFRQGSKPVTKIAWPAIKDAAAPEAELFHAAVLLSALPITLDRNRARGVPDAVTFETLDGLEVWATEYRNEHGRWGFDNVQFLVRHFSGRLLRLGRLEYELQPFVEPFAIFRRSGSADAVALVEGQLKVRRDGQFDGTNGIFDEHPWVTQFSSAGDEIVGNPVGPTGAIEQRTVELDGTMWQPVLQRGNGVLFVHIPAGWRYGPMADGACEESFKRAAAFFPQHYADHDPRAFVTRSWLLDAQLGQYLAADSNIMRFQRRFRLLAMPNSSDHQHIERVFGSGFSGWETAPQDTQLRRVSVQHVLAGGRWRNQAGFIPIDR